MKARAFRRLVVEAFVHATESPEAVERAVSLFAPGARVERRELGGHFGQRLTALHASLVDEGAILECLARLKAAVGPELAWSAARRVDPDLNLHIRFDKQAASRGEMRLEGARENDVVKVELRLRASRLDHAGAVALLQGAFGDPPEQAEE